MKEKLFYVEYKAGEGDYQPLGVMTMEDAFKWAWENGHAVVNFQPVDSLHAAETV